MYALIKLHYQIFCICIDCIFNRAARFLGAFSAFWPAEKC